jgi:hypothetical protein
VRRRLAGAATIAVLAACGDSTTGPENVASLSVSPTALQLTALEAAVQLTVTAENAGGEPVTGLTLTYTSSAPAVAGVSTGGVVTAEANGSATVTVAVEGSTISTTVPVTVAQVAFKLGFQSFTGGQARTAFGPVVVEVQDSLGNLVSATDSVTLAIGTNPGRLIFHASGIDPGDRIIELVDHVAPAVLAPPLQTTEGADELLDLAYDPAANVVYATDRSDILWSMNPVTGARTLVDTTGFYLKGLALEPGEAGRLVAGSNFEGGLVYVVDRSTAVATELGRVVASGDSILGFTGMAVDPTNGMLYSAVRLNSLAGRDRMLMTLNLTALAATSVGTLGEDGVSGLTFLPDGTLLAVTGDGATNPEQLWSVNKTNGAMTFIMNLGNGEDGEAIEAVPATLSGASLTVAASGGLATFENIMISAPGTGYTLMATAVGRNPGTSGAFDVSQ